MERRSLHTLRALGFFTCATLGGCAMEGDAAPDESADDADFRVGPALPASMASTNASLQTTATTGHAFAPARLLEVANDYAARYEGLSHDATPLGITYLKDADGSVTAMSVTYALVDDLTRPTANGLQTWINGQSTAIAAAIQDDDGPLPLAQIAGLRTPDEYLNVIVGATPRQAGLLSLTRGLPVQVYEQLGRRLIAAELGVALGTVSAGTAFYEATMDRSSRLGLRYSVTGKGTHLYFVPDGASPLGLVVPASTFTPVRTEAIAAYKTALATSLSEPASTPLATLLERKHAQQWGRTFALMDARSGAQRAYACTNCTALSNQLYDAGALDLHTQLFDTNDECDCVETYSDGSEQNVNDCGELDCCELVDGEFPEGEVCLVDCDCECEAQVWETVHYDHLLRGVPNLFQQQVNVPATPFCGGTVAVGCGAIAAAQIMVWYDTMGHDELLDHHHDTNGKFLWQDLSEELRNDYLDSHCIGGATWTTQADLATGIFNYFSDAGVSASVDHQVIEVADEWSAWTTIKNEIAENRPLILGLNASNGGPLGQGLINHYAVIAGHSTTVGTEEIYLSMGWGLGSNEIIEWDLVGQVHLYVIDVPDPPTGNEECMVDTPLGDLFAEDPNSLDWTANSSTYRDYPVVEHLTGSSPIDCDRIGGITEDWFDSHWTERNNCVTPHDVQVIEQTYDDLQEELDAGDIPDWIWE